MYQDVIFEHPVHRYIVWSRFNRYEEGKANVIDIPVVIESNNRNRYINRGNQDMMQKMNKIKVVSYNADYPSKFVIDPANLAPGKPYKVGDLQEILPSGIELHPMSRKRLHQVIVQLVGEEETYGLADRLDLQKDDNEEEDVKDEEDGYSQSEMMQMREEALKMSMTEASYEKFCKKRA